MKNDMTLCRLGWRIHEKWKDFRWRCQRFRRGYSQRDLWEMRTWFVETAKPMLQHMKDNHHSCPEELSGEEWAAILGEMIRLLEIMDVWDDAAARKELNISKEDDSYEARMKISKEKEVAKDQFFKLFSEWFWDLRD